MPDEGDDFNLLAQLKDAGISAFDNIKNIGESFKNPFIANEGDKDISNTAMGEMVKQFSSISRSICLFIISFYCMFHVWQQLVQWLVNLVIAGHGYRYYGVQQLLMSLQF